MFPCCDSATTAQKDVMYNIETSCNIGKIGENMMNIETLQH